MDSEAMQADNMPVPDPVIDKSVIGLILLVLLDVVCVIGNLILAVTYVKHPPPDIRIKCILSLVFASLCIGLFHIPISLVLIADPETFRGHAWPCHLASWIQNYCTINFLTNMDLVTVITYITIAYPLRSPSWLTARNYKIALSCVWLFPAVISSLLVIAQVINNLTPEEMLCEQVARRFSFRATMVLIFGFFLPSMAVHLGIQARIFWIARQQAREIAKARYVNLDLRETHQQSSKGFTVLAVYISSFLVVWIPLAIVLLIQTFCDQCLTDTLALVLLSLGITGAATLPLVFAAVNTLNRTAVKKTFSMMRLHSIKRRGV